MKIWENEPSGTLWATAGLLRDCFTFLVQLYFSVLYNLRGRDRRSFNLDGEMIGVYCENHMEHVGDIQEFLV
jgi:hypothetical protein